MNIQTLNNEYRIKRLNKNDIDDIYLLSITNLDYYECCPPMVTKESIEEDMNILPNGVSKENKYYLGYYDKDKLVALLDLILKYPDKETAFIGLLMLDASMQRKGIGTKIVYDLLNKLKDEGYQRIRLAYVKGNNKAERFWHKLGLKIVKETRDQENREVVLLEKRI